MSNANKALGNTPGTAGATFSAAERMTELAARFDTLELHQEVLDLFARHGSGDYSPTEEEKEIIQEGVEAILAEAARREREACARSVFNALNSAAKIAGEHAAKYGNGAKGRRAQREGGAYAAARDVAAAVIRKRT